MLSCLSKTLRVSTPGGPQKTTFCLRSMKPNSWRLSICCLVRPQASRWEAQVNDSNPLGGGSDFGKFL